MNALLFAAGTFSKFWFVIPMVIAVSLAYSATRHEDTRTIFRSAFKFGSWLLGFMLVILLILIWISTYN